MLFKLKAYQENTLEQLKCYLQGARTLGAKVAFYSQTDKVYNPVKQLPDLPYVCVRIPTGGGKTILAAHSIGLATTELLNSERCVALWLAPSNTIVQQTLGALRDRQHPYRQALESGCPGGVSVLDLKEALYLQRSALDGETVVIVSTLQALRVDETEGRKVYESAGALQHHFSGLTERQRAILGTGEEAERFSLANVLRLRRPVVIVDEAHNARTSLSFDTLERFNPSVILEFTATPDQVQSPSNVIHHVSAAELKAEAMIKLPIRLQTKSDWREAIAAAVAKLGQLATLAKENEQQTGEYIRPIALFQAQQQSASQESVNWETVKKCLIEDQKIDEDEIAVHTGTVRQLEGLDIKSRECRVKYIITVSALNEGWDCPFAYVLCSVQNLSSSTKVEQILGRVLRMPGAARKQHDDLNHAYAFATSNEFVGSAKGLEDALVQSGFERFEAQTNVKVSQEEFSFDFGSTFSITVVETVAERPNFELLPDELREKFRYVPLKNEIVYVGTPLSNDESKALQDCVAKPEDKKAIERLALKSAGKDYWPSARGEKLSIPRLSVRTQGQLEFVEDQFREFYWNLAECDPTLTEVEFSLADQQSRAAEVDISDQGKLETRYIAELHEQMSLLEMRGPQSASELSLWLDRQIPHLDILPNDCQLFLMKLVQGLIANRESTLEQLVKLRFRLRDAAREKIKQHRDAANTKAFQDFLFKDSAEAIEVEPSLAFDFPNSHYPANRHYHGTSKFRKHFYQVPADMNPEEVACAVMLDTSPSVLYWVRNLERSEYSFWLPTASDRFYPDFVALLTDGRYLVVEYKGEHLVTADDAKEKNAVGQLWESKSKGKCLFRMVTKRDLQPLLGTILN